MGLARNTTEHWSIRLKLTIWNVWQNLVHSWIVISSVLMVFFGVLGCSGVPGFGTCTPFQPYYCKVRKGHTWAKEAYTAGAYPGFCSMKQLRVLPLPPGWDTSPSQGYPQQYVAIPNLYTWVKRDKVSCFLKETTGWPALGLKPLPFRSEVQCTNHYTTAPSPYYTDLGSILLQVTWGNIQQNCFHQEWRTSCRVHSSWCFTKISFLNSLALL